MNPELSNFAAPLRERIAGQGNAPWPDFNSLALELFSRQFQGNPAYRRLCEARQLTPLTVADWTQIPAVPTSAFKELELSALAPAERTAVFHSSGTTQQKPSRHFHGRESLAVYETSLWRWFEPNFLTEQSKPAEWLFLTPPAASAPHSSLIHMFEIVRRKMGADLSAFVGQWDGAGGWTLDVAANLAFLNGDSGSPPGRPQQILGTAFSFVQLLDFLAEKDLRFELPAGSRVMETGGYKNRSRTMPKTELHALITDRLGVRRDNIICEYGMSELSSQAYDTVGAGAGELVPGTGRRFPGPERVFHFPPWARVRIISPETGEEVGEGETGLIRILDLANVFSVAAVQTEDLGVRRGDGFELVGRAAAAEPRGCSLMTA